MREPGVDGWRRFNVWVLSVAVGLLVAAWLLIVLVDPHDHLALSLPADRAPVNQNQRFSYPALARSARFDAAIIGTSTARLLRPADFEAALGARFVNLAMNSATAYEQSRILELFLRHHPYPPYLVIGLDVAWCQEGPDLPRYTFREFPEWLYDHSALNDYLHLLDGKSLEQAARMVELWLGRREPRYGRDGYRNFLPPESEYDLDRARGHVYGPEGPRERARPATPASISPAERAAWVFPGVDLLARSLAPVPPETRVVLFFVPYHVFHQPVPGTRVAARWQACRERVLEVARARPATWVLDFMIPSPITTRDEHYWDPLHFTTGVAREVARSIARAVNEPGYADAGLRRLHGP